MSDGRTIAGYVNEANRTFIDFGHRVYGVEAGMINIPLMPPVLDTQMQRELNALAGFGVGTFNAAAAQQRQQQELNAEMVRGAYDQAAAFQAQAAQIALNYEKNMRDLLLPGLPGLQHAVVHYAAGWLDPRGVWGVPPRLRVEVETAARSKERARGLLKSLLTPEQWAEFDQARRVTEKIGDMEFKLTPGGMIEARQPKLVERWCVYPQADEWLPDEDKLIGQLLHLRAGPQALRSRSNVFLLDGRIVAGG